MSSSDASDQETVLAADIGGTKILVALVRGKTVVTSRTIPTDRESGPTTWLGNVCDAARDWQGRFSCIGVTLTGQVHNGMWASVNRETLAVDEPVDLAATFSRIGVSFETLNDAQAAAWGEHVYGAARGSDLVYLTVSTGLGGGIVANGRLMRGHRGLAGHFGLTAQNLIAVRGAMEPFENAATGPWIARQATLETGRKQTAKDVFQAARDGAPWARSIVATSAIRVARLCRDISFTFDPPKIVIGGGVGLAEGYVPLVRQELAVLLPNEKIEILTSALRESAGIVGVAAFAVRSLLTTRRKTK